MRGINTYIYSVLALLLLLTPQIALATEYTSTNFKVRDPDINIGGNQGTTSTNFGGAGTSGQSVTGQSTSTNYVIKAGFQYFDQTNPVPSGVNCAGNAVPICDGATFGVQTTTTSSADTLAVNWSNNGTTALFSDPESGIYSYDYSIKRLSDNKYWSGIAWDVPLVRFNTPALGVSVTGLQLQAGVSYSFVLRAVNGAGLYTADFISPGILVLPALTFSISGVGNAQVIKSGVTTTTATADGLTLNFGTVVRNTSRIAAHDLNIATNSSQGYYVTVRVDRQLTCDACTGAPTIPSFPGTNANPLAWGSGNGLGYTTNNRKSLTDLSLTPTNRFSVSDIWSGFQTSSSANEVSYNSGPETAATRVGYQLRVDNNQLDGSYTNKIIYIATATY